MAPPFRIGFGFDTHALEEGRDLMLGGVRIEHPKGCAGHSDGDVLIHAIIDALLGAAGLADIGSHFPDTDPAYRNIDSRLLLARTMELITGAGWVVGNIDTTLVLQSPKLAPHIPFMKQQLAGILGIETGCVGIKAKTSEHLGFIGREEGVSAYAVVLLTK